jgi:N-methylhydantoinase A
VLRAKVLSTPEDYSLGIATGLESIVGNGGVDIADITQIMHGTTVATNAILEGKGATVALITTHGFRDVLEIRRLRMPVLYDIRWRKPPALVPRRLRFEVEERIDHLGSIERPLDETGANAVIDQILAAKVDAVAICLINSYANGVHELRLRDLIRARDASIPISVSSTLLPEIREYERTSTYGRQCVRAAAGPALSAVARGEIAGARNQATVDDHAIERRRNERDRRRPSAPSTSSNPALLRAWSAQRSSLVDLAT